MLAVTRPQKNFTLGPEARFAFESWCRSNGYEEKTVFLAGWRALMGLSHEERAELFKQVVAWADNDFRSDDELQSAGEVRGASDPGGPKSKRSEGLPELRGRTAPKRKAS